VSAMLTWLIVTMIGLLGCLAFGAWPLVRSRHLAPAWRGAMGMLCIAVGTVSFASVCTATAWADAAEQAATAASPAAEDDAKPNAEVEQPAAEAEAESTEPSNADAGSAPSSGSEGDKPGADDVPHSASEPGKTRENASPKAAPMELSADDITIEAEHTGVIIPPGRPSWVESPPMHVGEVHTTAVSSEPFARVNDCWQALDKELVRATDDYIVEHLGQSFATQFIHYDAKTIRSRFVKPENIYHEQIIVSIGPMHQVHALLEFKPEFRAELDERWAQVTRYSRLTQVGLGSFALLALLSVVFGYFRLDNATRGYYTGRLQFLTAAAILAIVGVGVVAARWVVWM
jgi:hypothetical protein